MNKNNALHAVLFEAVALATMLDLPDASLLSESCTTLGGALLRNFILGSHPS